MKSSFIITVIALVCVSVMHTSPVPSKGESLVKRQELDESEQYAEGDYDSDYPTFSASDDEDDETEDADDEDE